ncbi:hypothetical protein DH2020_005019 [Rehmannia glutinosa]|uniref:Protein kinase domain-containing protein n=1 Tax=Rehmannia glutinosa TaxID=99300 RepID=A0ABR0XRD4_REHGL
MAYNTPADAPIFPIYESVSPGIVEVGRSGKAGKGTNQRLLTALIAASTALGLISILFIFYIYYYRKKSQDKNNDHRFSCSNTNCSKKRSSASILMEYKTLELATDNFGDSNILGAGGFGCVYKGKLDGDFCVAVKRLSIDAITEFQTEVDILSKIQHPNIITLLGYSIHAESRLLVYELMQYGSLETQLHDFGLAVLDGPRNKNNIKPSGTLGYVAPEYLLDGKLTDKSDVYAFGVVLLELLLGRKPMEKLGPAQCHQSIVTWAMPQLTDRTKLPNIVDPVISNSMDLKHLYQVAAVAVLCVQPEPSYRPLITDILHSLVPLVPVELGGTLRNAKTMPSVATNSIPPES